MVPKPPPGPPPARLLVAAALRRKSSPALAGQLVAIGAPLAGCNRPMAKPPSLADRRPQPKLQHGAGDPSSGASVAKSISKRPRVATALAGRCRSFLKGHARKDMKKGRSGPLASGPSSSSGAALAPPVPSDPARLQLRLTWWGFVNHEEVDRVCEERIQRNGGIVAFSNLLAPELPSDWAPAGCCRCEGAGPLQVMVNPYLIPDCLRMRVYTRLLVDQEEDTYIELAMGVWRAFAAQDLGLALDQFDFAVVSVTLKQPQGLDVDPKVPALEVADDWFQQAETQLKEWLSDLTPAPRFILGHLGQLAMAFADILQAVTREHACWAGAGPTALAGDIASGGVWIIGPHKMLTGSANPEDDHESIYDMGLMTQLPSVRTASTERFGYQVGTPTLFVGRSKRGNMHSKVRSKTEHVKYTSTEHGRCLS